MSQKPRPKESLYFGFSKSALAVLILIFAISLPLLIAHPWTQAHHLDWPAVPGHVLETRIVAIHQRDHELGPGEVDYQVGAHVIYERDGAPFQNNLQTRHFLNSGYHKKKDKSCTVRWPPKNPVSTEAVLY